MIMTASQPYSRALAAGQKRSPLFLVRRRGVRGLGDGDYTTYMASCLGASAMCSPLDSACVANHTNLVNACQTMYITDPNSPHNNPDSPGTTTQLTASSPNYIQALAAAGGSTQMAQQASGQIVPGPLWTLPGATVAPGPLVYASPTPAPAPAPAPQPTQATTNTPPAATQTVVNPTPPSQPVNSVTSPASPASAVSQANGIATTTGGTTTTQTSAWESILDWLKSLGGSTTTTPTTTTSTPGLPAVINEAPTGGGGSYTVTTTSTPGNLIAGVPNWMLLAGAVALVAVLAQKGGK